jgi:DNA-binding response OmpR family regulator
VRLRALVRRARGAQKASPMLTVGELTFDTANFEARRAGRPLALTRTGFTILRMLMKEAPNVVTREALEQELWGEDRPDSDALRTHIHALRQALDKPHPFAMLRTIPGIGYKLVSEADE